MLIKKGKETEVKTHQEKVIFHVDMNNFYASVECLLNPSLKNYAVAVAGDPNKRTGIILAKNYLAKVFGVKTGEVIWEAKKKCPSLICVAPHHELYEEYSKKAHEIYYKYTDIIEPFGIDECWLDVTGSLNLFNSSPLELAKKIQQDIFNNLGLSVSIGISFGKTLAKLGSDMKKPFGLTVIDHQNHIEILKKLKVEDMIMIGKHTAKKLHEMNINSLFDLYQQPVAFLKKKFGVVGEYLHDAVLGKDDELIVPKDEDTKSVGNGATAIHDMTTKEEIVDFLHDLSAKVSRRLRAHGFSAKTIHVGIKYSDLTWNSAQSTKSIYFCNEQDIFKFAFEIFSSLAGDKFPPVRALRISTSNLIMKNESQQENLFSNTKNENLCLAIDNLKEKFGDNVITFAKDFREF